MRIGFIGLGHMGAGMAHRLLASGHTLAVYNRTRAKAEPLAAEGARVADSPADAAQGAEVVVTMVADDRALEAVTDGPDGLLSALAPGAIHLSMSTISVALSERLAREHQAAGQRYVAAPVFGRPEAAAAGALTIVTAGEAADVERCVPIFEALGPRRFYFGSAPAVANVIKLSGNFLLASTIESLGEAFALVRKHGVAPQDYLAFLRDSLFASPAVKTYGGFIAAEQYQSPAGFKLPLALKDVRLALSAADAQSVPMPVASLIHDQMLSAIARGYGELDFSSLGRFAAENAGL